MNTQIKHMAGERFGRLIVQSFAKCDRNGNAMWLCNCDCGSTITVRRAGLINGGHKSCGCANRERLKSGSVHRSHGMSKLSIYRSWRAMMTRCCNSKSQNYARYGGRGITVCKEWHSFAGFAADMSPRPEGKSLDRINVNGNYEPSNTTWSDQKKQCRNQVRNRVFTIAGKRMTLAEISEKFGIRYSLLHERLSYGWTIEKAIDAPVRKISTRRK